MFEWAVDIIIGEPDEDAELDDEDMECDDNEPKDDE